MAAKKPNDAVRLGARLDNDTAALLELLAFAANLPTGRIIPMALLALLDSLPKGQKETIQRAMPIRQASLSRLRKSCSPSQSENEQESPVGECIGSDLADGAQAVKIPITDRIGAIARRSTLPVDQSIADIAGG